ncbi:MAG: phosphonoacetaldehyde hydrolase [Acidaminococcales bacterium]|jgi:phosphonoacetaldehyde hydrolase|nr:phosphonoacetaldehyde hydrolase [Acidaminococcales bacterium]
MTTEKIEGVVFDWAGTTVDFGCFAPVNAFLRIFADAGVSVTLDEARKPMGMLKRDHIKTMLAMPRIEALWREKKGRGFDDADVNALYADFEPILLSSLARYTEPLPYVVETTNMLREKGYKIGSTTGYTDGMMKLVTKGARDNGYQPDCWVTPDSTGSMGRPYPYMIYRNMEKLRLAAPWRVIKVGDTASDIREGLQAAVWSVGVAAGSSEMGLGRAEFESLPEDGKKAALARTRELFASYGAHFTIETMKELPALIERIDGLLSQGQRPYGRF